MGIEASRGWQNSLPLAMVEFVLLGVIFIADAHHLIPFSKTPELVVLGWISLRIRGMRWRDVGLAGKHSLATVATVGVLCGVGIELIELYVSQPLIVRITHRVPDISDFNNL